MIDFTRFFSFKKPDENEFYNVALNNENLDSIDEALEAHTHDKRYYTKTENDAHLSNKANANPQTGAALDAEKLNGTSAYATLDGKGYITIMEHADLNSAEYRTVGAYTSLANALVKTYEHSPFQSAFIMYSEFALGGYLRQRAIRYNDGAIKQRTWNYNGEIESLDWYETAQIESGTWTPSIIVSGNTIVTIHKAVGKWTRIGKEWLITLETSITFSTEAAPQYTINGLPIVFPTGMPVDTADVYNGSSSRGNYGFILNGKILLHPGVDAKLGQNKSELFISIKGVGI